MMKTLTLALLLVVGVNFIADAGHSNPAVIHTVGGGLIGAYVFFARLWQ